MSEGYRIGMRDGAVVLTLDLGKANAMDARFFEVLDGALREAERARPCGLVLTGSGRAFCAGLNLAYLQPLDRDGMRAFLGGFREAFLRLLRFPGRTVAAVNGHAVAGGAILACACDHRVGAEGEYQVGVRETALAVGLPRVGLELLRRALPDSSFEEIVLGADLYTPEEALRLGLLHELVPAGRLLDDAVSRATRYRDVPWEALRQVRRGIVAPYVERVQRQGDDEEWLDTWFSDEARKRIGEVLARLARKG